MDKKYTLQILGEKLPITSDQGDDYVDELYNTITATLNKIEEADKNSSMSKMTKSLYLAIFLADELLRSQKPARKKKSGNNAQ
ncbi:MAG: cell division protein ZapA [Defluviitaleaceae bacterium]|nr:cell division protein ZapA [Defluviitaleaceae bacterium]